MSHPHGDISREVRPDLSLSKKLTQLKKATAGPAWFRSVLGYEDFRG